MKGSLSSDLIPRVPHLSGEILTNPHAPELSDPNVPWSWQPRRSS